MHPAWFALIVGVIAAVSLPFGAIVGLATKPGERVTSALLAFGAGTLIFALSVEIVATSLPHGGFLPLGLGMVLGGLIFEGFNQALNQRGAFLRKLSVAGRYIASQRKRREQALLKRLANVHLLQSLPPEDIAPLVEAAQLVRLQRGEELFHEGDAGSSLYLVDAGELEVIRGGARVAILAPGDTVGEMAVVTGAPRTATIRALDPTQLFYIPKPAFDQLVQSAARVRDRVAELIKLRTEELKERLLVSHAEADQWQAAAAACLKRAADEATPEDIKRAAEEQEHGPVLGVWLGNLLDCIPEALVLGSTVEGVGAMSWPLLAGIFLNNFPEAMSGSAVMRMAGLKRQRIIIMWVSVVVVSGLCGALGNMTLNGVSEHTVGIVEGTAAGAMLVMIAETLLPEAYERGGAIAGMSTLLGFLAALAVKSIS